MLSFFSKRESGEAGRGDALKMDGGELRRLALTDSSEEVRQEALRRIDDQAVLLEVVRGGRMPDTRAMALARINDHEARVSVALDRTLPEALRAQALVGLKAEPRLRELYRPKASDAFKRALFDALGDTANDEFWGEVARLEPSAALRARAFGHIRSERLCAELSRVEPDPELRRMLTDLVGAPELLRQLIDIQTSDSERMRLLGRVSDPLVLESIACSDRDVRFRLEALARVRDAKAVLRIACAEVPAEVALAALVRLGDDESRGLVAMHSPHEDVRAEAFRTISDEGVWSRLEDESPWPEIRWLAGRKMGSVPTKAIAEIRSSATLRRLIEQETEPEVSTWLVGRVKDDETLRVLSGTSFPGTMAAQRRLKEREGPLGIRFMAVPGRPFEMSLFPVTNGQMRAALGAEFAGKGPDDLPATGFPPELALRFCEVLASKAPGAYRLPSFEEWRHACMAGDENWFDAATGKFSWGEALLGTRRLAFDCKGRRAASLAWPNPWGFLDMVGNVAVWVDDSPRRWLQLAADDPLAQGGDPGYPSGFAMAAGVSWADVRVRKDRLARLVARSALGGWASDKVGLRVVCEREGAAGPASRYKVVLLPDVAAGFTRQGVSAAVTGVWPEAGARMPGWYKVAPAVVAPSLSYADARRAKQLLESCGACVQVTAVPVAAQA